MGSTLDFAGQRHGFQDFFRSKAGGRSLFVVMLETGNAVRRRGRPEADQERGLFIHSPFLLDYSFLYKTEMGLERLRRETDSFMNDNNSFYPFNILTIQTELLGQRLWNSVVSWISAGGKDLSTFR
jgi:hypothetical protein